MTSLESMISGICSSRAAAKSAVGHGNPEILTAHNRACGFFVCVARLRQSMVGRAGQSKGWPGSVGTGISTPVRLTTRERGNSGGELSKRPTEVATMAASGDTCAQKHITDLCVIASEHADQLAEEIEISEVRA